MPHGFPRGDFARTPERGHCFPVVRQWLGRTSEMLAPCFCRVNAFPLPPADGQALLLGNGAHDFDQDVVYHLKYLLLPLR